MTLDEMIDTQLFQLNALSKPYDYQYVSMAKMRKNTNLAIELCTGQFKTLQGYLDQMVQVFGDNTPPVNKARALLAEGDVPAYKLNDELAFSYFLGYAWFEEEWGGTPRDVAVVTPH